MRHRDPFYKARYRPGAGPHTPAPRGSKRRQATAELEAEVAEALAEREGGDVPGLRRRGGSP